MAKTNTNQEGSAAGEKLLAQGTLGRSTESCTPGGRFAFFALSQSDRMELRAPD